MLYFLETSFSPDYIGIIIIIIIFWVKAFGSGTYKLYYVNLKRWKFVKDRTSKKK